MKKILLIASILILFALPAFAEDIMGIPYSDMPNTFGSTSSYEEVADVSQPITMTENTIVALDYCPTFNPGYYFIGSTPTEEEKQGINVKLRVGYLHSFSTDVDIENIPFEPISFSRYGGFIRLYEDVYPVDSGWVADPQANETVEHFVQEKGYGIWEKGETQELWLPYEVDMEIYEYKLFVGSPELKSLETNYNAGFEVIAELRDDCLIDWAGLLVGYQYESISSKGKYGFDIVSCESDVTLHPDCIKHTMTCLDKLEVKNVTSSFSMDLDQHRFILGPFVNLNLGKIHDDSRGIMKRINLTGSVFWAPTLLHSEEKFGEVSIETMKGDVVLYEGISETTNKMYWNRWGAEATIGVDIIQKDNLSVGVYGGVQFNWGEALKTRYHNAGSESFEAKGGLFINYEFDICGKKESPPPPPPVITPHLENGK